MKQSILLVTDLDGTFVYDSKTVRQKDIIAIRDIQLMAMTAIATGRSIREIQYIEKQAGISVDYHIAFNGALVQDNRGNTLIDKPMDRETVERLTYLFTEYGLVFDALDGHARWGNFRHEERDTLWGMEFVLLAAPYATLQDKRIYKINIRPQEGDAQRIVDLLKRAIPEVTAYQTGLCRIEVVRNDVSKALGVLTCVTYAQQIVAIGDASNDVEMFEIADISYCIAHAPQKVRKQAQKIVPYFADAISDFQDNCNAGEELHNMYSMYL